jgi:hypothetical protein
MPMENVLLLNASFEPLRVIHWKRALTLLFSGKVEVIEEYTREIHGVSLTIHLPAVVRLVSSFACGRGITLAAAYIRS